MEIMGIEARREFEMHYTAEKNISQLEKIYENILSDSSGIS